MLVGRDLNVLGLAEVEGIDGTQIRGALHNDHVAGIAEQSCHVVKTLLAAGSHKDMADVGLNLVPCLHTVDDMLSQGGVAVSGAILQSLSAVLLENCLGGGQHLLNREKLGSRETSGKGYNLGTGSKCQQLSDFRGLDVVHSFSKIYHELSS